jgi:hypothetical protein
MSHWFRFQNYSHQTQLVGAAIIGGLAAVTTVYSIQAIRRNVALEDLKASIPQLSDKHKTQKVQKAKLSWCYANADEILTSLTNSVVLLRRH